jgi:hypothetical protein
MQIRKGRIFINDESPGLPELVFQYYGRGTVMKESARSNYPVTDESVNEKGEMS